MSESQLQTLCAALGWQGGTFWQVLETVQHMAAQSSTPVAWAVFAPNGNIRMWSTNTETIQQFARDNGVVVTPLYANPPIAGVVPTAAWLVPMLNAKPRLFTDLAEARAFCAQQNGMVYPQPLIVAPGYPYRAHGGKEDQHG